MELGIVINASQSDDVPKVINDFAIQVGISFFKDMAKEDPKGYGFANMEELERIELGRGFEVHWIDFDALKKTTLEKFNNVSSFLKKPNEWTYLVMLDGKAKSFITFGLQDEKPV